MYKCLYTYIHPYIHTYIHSEVQRTMLELLAQLDGFEATQNIKVIMATNRIDILDSGNNRTLLCTYVQYVCMYVQQAL